MMDAGVDGPLMALEGATYLFPNNGCTLDGAFLVLLPIRRGFVGSTCYRFSQEEFCNQTYMAKLIMQILQIPLTPKLQNLLNG